MSGNFQFSIPPDQVETEFSVLIFDLYLLYRKYFNRQMKGMSLTSVQWQVLSSLVRNDGITQTEVADLLNKGKSPVGKTLDSLESAGWIVRKPNSKDRRVKNVFLTDKLQAIDPELTNVLSDMNRVAEAELDNASLEQVKSGLVVMRENLRRALT
ncbi:MAG: MarR family winged helix-turn-helix transcriptional regulator [Pseudomonadales bacterium]|jgi:DNA-binding MarR family transcriptional regulator|nr:MarR family winged helix-turn-helix transcriptional regulator [Pseudomonadales bacterium]MDP6315648.1 MarR family winged helix-turn-helix transcriptional regulator [Pseudomonadales bacterium]MDP7313560.1 MarR family winged helix-turn-helix transcriptional regulator [Pseudomonadales bacterium]|tara:strand:+ start:16 stop:480 length:465 start_codon:yes stop_codon:yes gene_type:complete